MLSTEVRNTPRRMIKRKKKLREKSKNNYHAFRERIAASFFFCAAGLSTAGSGQSVEHRSCAEVRSIIRPSLIDHFYCWQHEIPIG